MKQTILFLLSLACSATALTQANRLSYTATLTFQGYSMPFKHLGDNFKNIGGSVGVAYAYNRSQALSQRVAVGFLSHREHGNGFYLNTQFCYQPVLFSALVPSLAIGIGHLFSFANGHNPYYSNTNGAWGKSSKQSQSHWQVPVSIGIGYKIKTAGGAIITPTVGYEAAAILNYNSAFPILPYSLITVGSKITLPNHIKTN